MENFDWGQFSKRIFINTDLETVYNYWTKSEELEKWFLSKASFYSKEGKEILPTSNVGSLNEYNWRWYAQDSYEEGLFLLANGVDLMEFTFAGQCRVQIKLTEVKNQVLIELLQKDIPLDENSKEDIRLGCAFGWSFYLLNLKSILEGGIDLRNKDTELVGVVNN